MSLHPKNPEEPQGDIRGQADLLSTEAASQSMVESTEDGDVLTTFTCFPKLPAEIRVMIWKLTFPGPSLILDRASTALLYAYWYRQLEHQDFRKWPSIYPVALFVCQESRLEAQKIFSIMRYRSGKDYKLSMVNDAPGISANTTGLNPQGYGSQYINFDADTLYLPHSSIIIKSERVLPRKAHRMKVRSLMIHIDRYISESTPNTVHLLDSDFKATYGSIIPKFPNLQELYLRTNWKPGCNIPAKIPAQWSNELTLDLSNVSSDDCDLLGKSEEDFEEDVDAEDSLDFRQWVWDAKRCFEEEKRDHPQYNGVELKFLGGVYEAYWIPFSCGCCGDWDGLKLFDHTDHPCLEMPYR